VRTGKLRYVLDSFALLAYLGGEPGQEQVKEILAGAERGEAEVYLCLVNLGEVIYITERKLGLAEAQRALAAIEQLPIQVIEANRELTLGAAHIKASHPLSFSDALAMALGLDKGAVLVTGDPEFRAVEGLVAIEWIAEVS